MEPLQGAGDPFPLLHYRRFLLPDIAPMVAAGLGYLSESAYANLLYLNGRVRVLDERNAHFSQFFYMMLQTDLSAQIRAKAATVIADDIKFVVQLAAEAKQYAQAPGLLEWLRG